MLVWTYKTVNSIILYSKKITILIEIMIDIIHIGIILAGLSHITKSQNKITNLLGR